jgi:hypothetical protein
MPTTSVIPKSYRLLNSRKFLLGFEVEFVFKTKHGTFSTVARKFRELNSEITCVDDCSINPEHRHSPNDMDLEIEKGMEVRTPPLIPSQAFELLAKVFKLVSQLGYTNESCGFHFNFSPVSEKLYYKIDPFKFTVAPLWEQIAEDFGRKNNENCLPVWEDGKTPKSKLEIFRALSESEYGYDGPYPRWSKDAAVNFEYYGPRKYAESRVEVRTFGNKGYHQKLPKIRKYGERILNLFVKCCA